MKAGQTGVLPVSLPPSEGRREFHVRQCERVCPPPAEGAAATPLPRKCHHAEASPLSPRNVLAPASLVFTIVGCLLNSRRGSSMVPRGSARPRRRRSTMGVTYDNAARSRIAASGTAGQARFGDSGILRGRPARARQVSRLPRQQTGTGLQRGQADEQGATAADGNVGGRVNLCRLRCLCLPGRARLRLSAQEASLRGACVDGGGLGGNIAAAAGQLELVRASIAEHPERVLRNPVPLPGQSLASSFSRFCLTDR